MGNLQSNYRMANCAQFQYAGNVLYALFAMYSWRAEWYNLSYIVCVNVDGKLRAIPIRRLLCIITVCIHIKLCNHDIFNKLVLILIVIINYYYLLFRNRLAIILQSWQYNKLQRKLSILNHGILGLLMI
jgi:hypothetical protein